MALAWHIFGTIRYWLGYSNAYSTPQFETKLRGGSTICQRGGSRGGTWDSGVPNKEI